MVAMSGTDETMALGLTAAAAARAPAKEKRQLPVLVPPPIRRRLALVLVPLLLVGAVALMGAALTSGGGAKAIAKTSPSASASVAPACCVVPQMVGLPLDIAIERLRAAGFRLGDAILQESTEADGVIISQSVPAGRSLERGSTVDLTWSKYVAPTPRGKKHKGHGGD